MLLLCLGLTTILWVGIEVSLNTWGVGSLIFSSDPSFCDSFITPVLMKWPDCYKCVDSVEELRLNSIQL